MSRPETNEIPSTFLFAGWLRDGDGAARGHYHASIGVFGPPELAARVGKALGGITDRLDDCGAPTAEAECAAFIDVVKALLPSLPAGATVGWVEVMRGKCGNAAVRWCP